MVAELPDSPPGPNDLPSTYGGHDIKDNEKQREKTKEAADHFLDSLITRLSTLFPDHDLLGAFSCLKEEQEGHESIEKLIAFYGEDKKIAGETFKALVDPEATLTEWHMLQPLVPKYNTLRRVYRYIDAQPEGFPNLHKLVQVALTVPITSVNCERGVSRYNAIKTDGRYFNKFNSHHEIDCKLFVKRDYMLVYMYTHRLIFNHPQRHSRSGLLVPTVNTLMTLSVEALPYRQFDYDPAFQIWTEQKERRAYLAMINEGQASKPSASASAAAPPPAQDAPLDLSINLH